MRLATTPRPSTETYFVMTPPVISWSSPNGYSDTADPVCFFSRSPRPL
jgi:hypothetical protein